MKENSSSDKNNNETKTENNIQKQKRKLSQIEKDIKKLNYLSFFKIKKKYDSNKKAYEKIIINILLNNVNCHLVSVFKEKMLTDYVDEFLRRKYSSEESKERIPKFAVYYKNYLLFFCKPTFSNFAINDIINDYGERRAEIYYKYNYQGGKSNEQEDYGFEESDSEEESEKDNKFKENENGEIFDNSVKENIDNVTIMTTINNSKNNTINLNLNNEKIEVFSENKCDHSNDTTLHEITDIVKKGQLYNETTQTKDNNNIDNNNLNNIENNFNNFSSSNNYNKSKKGNKYHKQKKDILNLINFKKAAANRGGSKSKSKQREQTKSLKKYIEKNNLDLNINSKETKLKNKVSVDKIQKLFKKTGIKSLNFYKKNPKMQIPNFINIFNINNKNTNDKLKEKEKENKKKSKEFPSSKKTSIKFSNHSVNLHLKNQSISKEKESDKKSLKNTMNNNRFAYIKNSYGNISNNILQKNNINNYNYYIGGDRMNKNNSKSRNNTGFLYKQQTHTNNILHNNIMYNLNSIYNTTSLNKLSNKNLNNKTNNNNGYGYLGKMNPFKTLNFVQGTNAHQPYNNNYIQIHNIKDNKYHISNTSEDNKYSSLKILLTDMNNPNRNKPNIKFQNEKDFLKSKYNNKDNNIYDLNHNNKNQRITKSYNNLNINNLHGINSYNNMNCKKKRNQQQGMPQTRLKP